MKQLNIRPHLRKGIPPDVCILYGKPGCISSDILTNLVAGVQTRLPFIERASQADGVAVSAREPIDTERATSSATPARDTDATPNPQAPMDEDPTHTERDTTEQVATSVLDAPPNLQDPLDDDPTQPAGADVAHDDQALTPEYVSLPRQPRPVVIRDYALVDP